VRFLDYLGVDAVERDDESSGAKLRRDSTIAQI
jgi:hypothetical protein